MANITPIKQQAAPVTEAATVAEVTQAEPAADESVSETPAASVKASVEPMPSIEELLARNRKLEAEKNDAVEQAAGYKQQMEQIRDRKPIPVEMTTTTTKPVWGFDVSGPMGTETFKVVDESEAKRLYCVKHKIDPSLFVLQVKCTQDQARKASITQQYTDAGADAKRIPGVNIGV